MSEDSTERGRTDKASRVIAAQPDAIYEAFEEPHVLMAWLPPGNMTGRVLEYDFREGGKYRIELAYAGEQDGVGKTTGGTDISSGRFVSLEPGRRIMQSVEFESADDTVSGEMTMTWVFERVSDSTTRVTVTAGNVPAGIGKADHDAGLRGSLENLARYVEATPTPG